MPWLVGEGGGGGGVWRIFSTILGIFVGGVGLGLGGAKATALLGLYSGGTHR